MSRVGTAWWERWSCRTRKCEGLVVGYTLNGAEARLMLMRGSGVVIAKIRCDTEIRRTCHGGTSFVEGARTVSLESYSTACRFTYFEVDGLGCVFGVQLTWYGTNQLVD
jgi:hypothetical protein